MDWIKVDITVPNEAVEAISDYLLELCPSGLQITEESENKSTRLTVYISDKRSSPEIREAITHYIHDIESHGIDMRSASININTIQDEDWAENYKKFFTVTRIGRIIIKPSWEDIDAGDDDVVVELDPGMAFGTGAHATTSGCLQFLQKYMQPGQSVLDIGTGSGILAIAAAKLGASEVIAVDNDKDAVNIARENAVSNDVDQQIEFCVANFGQCKGNLVDLVVANLTSYVIIQLLLKISERMSPRSILILSGITSEQIYDVVNELNKFRLAVIDEIDNAGWITVAVKHV